MHITQLLIQGFKSYKDQTVFEPFSPRHNVIVGRNGSGKSNFFWAIRFVLNDAYTTLHPEERAALLHEGSGPASLTAFVEIVFDNADYRFPTGKETVVLRRTIGKKKDEYSLDKKSATRAEVTSLLESAGFSSANPYYIVPQGRITGLCNQRDGERLKLLKDVAGTGVYESRRAESLKILDETHGKRAKIDALMAFITERLEELDKEKTELQAFTKLDRDRRALEYAMLDRELDTVSKDLDALDAERLDHLQSAHHQRDLIQRARNDLEQSAADVAARRQELDDAAIDRDAAAAAVGVLRQRGTELELQLADAQSTESAALLDEKVADLDAVRGEIARLRQQLAQWEPEAETHRTSARALAEELKALQARRRALAAKQGRAGQFASTADWSAHLDAEIARVRDALARGAITHAELLHDAEAIASDLQRAVARADALQGGLDSAKAGAEAAQADLVAARRDRDALAARRKELWATESKASTAVQQARDAAERHERSAMSTCDRATAQGLRMVREIASELQLDGVYGPLYQLMDVPDVYKSPVEVVGGTSIFQVVVEDDQVASLLLKKIKERPGNGRVSLMPLNRLRVKHTVYPDDDKVVPMVQQIRFDPKFQRAFTQVYGRAVICPDLDTAWATARRSGLTTVTLQGDKAERKGGMAGGYVDPSRSRLEAALQYTTALRALEAAERVQAEAAAALGSIDQQVTAAASRVQHLELAMQRRAEEGDGTGADWQAAKHAANLLERTRAALQAQIDKVAADIRAHEVQLEALQQERATATGALPGGLSAAERAELTGMEQQLAALRRDWQAATAAEAQADARISQARSLLDNRLMRKEIDLKREVLDLEQALREMDQERLQADLASVRTKLKAAQAAKRDADTRIEAAKAALDAAAARHDQQQQALLDRQRKAESEEQVLARYQQRRTVLADMRDELKRRSRDLGVRPDDQHAAAVGNIPHGQVVLRLKTVHEQLKKYAHVNKKALEQYANFAKQQETLVVRKKELDDSEKSIHNLIESLDQSKDEAIQRTFAHVASNFSKVFEELVPAGRGRLVMLDQAGAEVAVPDPDVDGAENDHDDNMDLGEEDDQDEDAMDVDGASPAARRQRGGRRGGSAATAAATARATAAAAARRRRRRPAALNVDACSGVSIQVSFNSKADEGLHMGQLSGGQKSLVALGLIFAIQQCDPAPFYLFDEIDANLDAQYRTAVANKIHALADHAQFITTTFRPELLAHADKFYGVSFKDKASKIQCISRDDAMGFVELGEVNPVAVQ
ncbi:RecF/RecN/SMC [Blastocladiella britannica]|nr:RecF/RecN/SMC [Blastocladiella britannica]